MVHRILAVMCSGFAVLALTLPEPAEVRADDWEDYWEDYWDDFKDYREYRRGRYRHYDRDDDWDRRRYDRYDYRPDRYRYRYRSPDRYYDEGYYRGYDRDRRYYRDDGFHGRFGPLRIDVWD